MGNDWKDGGGVLFGYCGEFRASPCSLRSRPPSLCEGRAWVVGGCCLNRDGLDWRMVWDGV